MPSYDWTMTAIAWRRGLAGLLSVFVFLIGSIAHARAATTLIPSTGAPFIIVQLGSGSVTIRTWNRSDVQIAADPSISFHHAPPRDFAARAPQQIMLWSEKIATPAGTFILGPEPFLLPAFAPGAHDALVVHGDGAVIITIPEQSPLIDADVRLGSVTIDDFRGTAFVAHVVTGDVHLSGDAGTGAIQVNNGPVVATGSTFDRLRVRTGRGNIAMTNCVARQIEVTSLAGSILYDDGTFEPGLAHFESERGNITLGLASGAQIQAHSDAGKILYDAGGDGRVTRSAQDAQATLEGGGPVVTATSGSGAIFFFDGSLRDHPAFARRFAHRRHRPHGF
jgi:hypothetical protein